MKLSKVKKLDGIYSWSLPAGVHCPGKIGDNPGTVADVCKDCYAMRGNYRFKNIMEPRKFNAEDWKTEDWTRRMVQALKGKKYFRWVDSGDIYHIRLAEKILEVMKQTPDTLHWLPTRMGKFPKFAAILARMDALPNVAVRFSSDSISGQFGPEHGSTVIDVSLPVPNGVTVCHAYISESDRLKHGKRAVAKCHGCRACWDKSIKVIGYKGHGVSMLKSQLENRT